MSSEPRPDFLARLRVRTRRVGCPPSAGGPWRGTRSTLAAVHVAYARLEYHTQRNDLLSADKPCQQRWQKYLDAFGDDDDMVVVAEGTDRERMTAALDAVAERVQERPGPLRPRVPQGRSAPLSATAPAVPAAGPDRSASAAGSTAWSRSWARSARWHGRCCRPVAARERRGRRSTARARRPRTVAADRDLLAQLPAVASERRDTLRDPAAYRNPWAVGSANRDADRDAERQLDEPQYFFTPDGSLALLTCRPKKAAQSFTPAKEANDAMRAILAQVGPRFPDVKLGLTGLPVLETDEMVLSDADSTRASWLALVGVAVLYFVVYRGFRYPLLTVGTLVVGTLWALGWATLTVGHLNILSATFAVMLIGMGDYGVLWVTQYDEARKRGESVDEATAAHRRARRAEHPDGGGDDGAGVLRGDARRLQGGRRARLDRRLRRAALRRELPHC